MLRSLLLCAVAAVPLSLPLAAVDATAAPAALPTKMEVEALAGDGVL